MFILYIQVVYNNIHGYLQSHEEPKVGRTLVLME